MFMDVGFAVLTAESELVIDFKGGEHLSEVLPALVWEPTLPTSVFS